MMVCWLSSEICSVHFWYFSSLDILRSTFWKWYNFRSIEILRFMHYTVIHYICNLKSSPFVVMDQRQSGDWISASSIVVFVFVSSLSSNIQWICYLRSSVIIMYLPCLWSMLVHWITLMILYISTNKSYLRHQKQSS